MLKNKLTFVLCICLCLSLCIYMHFYCIGCFIHSYTVSEIGGFASQFATQNFLSCYSKLNLSSKFHAKVVTHLPHLKLKIIYTLNVIL